MNKVNTKQLASAISGRMSKKETAEKYDAEKVKQIMLYITGGLTKAGYKVKSSIKQLGFNAESGISTSSSIQEVLEEAKNANAILLKLGLTPKVFEKQDLNFQYVDSTKCSTYH